MFTDKDLSIKLNDIQRRHDSFQKIIHLVWFIVDLGIHLEWDAGLYILIYKLIHTRVTNSHTVQLVFWRWEETRETLKKLKKKLTWTHGEHVKLPTDSNWRSGLNWRPRFCEVATICRYPLYWPQFTTNSKKVLPKISDYFGHFHKCVFFTGWENCWTADWLIRLWVNCRKTGYKNKNWVSVSYCTTVDFILMSCVLVTADDIHT